VDPSADRDAAHNEVGGAIRNVDGTFFFLIPTKLIPKSKITMKKATMLSLTKTLAQVVYSSDLDVITKGFTGNVARPLFEPFLPSSNKR